MLNEKLIENISWYESLLNEFDKAISDYQEELEEKVDDIKIDHIRDGMWRIQVLGIDIQVTIAEVLRYENYIENPKNLKEKVYGHVSQEINKNINSIRNQQK